MNRFTCDLSYENDLKEYTEQILEKNGVSSQAAEREIMCMADEGNTVAGKLYADLVFYKKILRKNPYREAFDLYLGMQRCFLSAVFLDHRLLSGQLSQGILPAKM